MTNGRTVRANMSLTLDGRYNGPGGPGDLAAIVPYATTDVARNHLTRPSGEARQPICLSSSASASRRRHAD